MPPAATEPHRGFQYDDCLQHVARQHIIFVAARLCSHYNELLLGSNGTEGETTSPIDLTWVVVFCARVQWLFSWAQKSEVKGESIAQLLVDLGLKAHPYRVKQT